MYKILIFVGIFILLIYPVWKFVEFIFKSFDRKKREKEFKNPGEQIKQMESEILDLKSKIKERQNEEMSLLDSLDDANKKLEDFNGFKTQKINFDSEEKTIQKQVRKKRKKKPKKSNEPKKSN